MFIGKVFVPVTSLVRDEVWLVQIAFIVPVVPFYFTLFKNAKTYSVQPCGRWCSILLIWLLCLSFRWWGNYKFYGVLAGLSYIDITFILVVVLEFVLQIYIHCLKRKNVEESYNLNKLEAEVPAKTDNFDRKRYAELLINKISHSQRNGTTVDHAFTILLNERYGAGKTSFFNFVREQASSKNMIVMDFKSWLCDSPSSIITSFFRSLASDLGGMDVAIGDLLDAYSKLVTDKTTGKIAEYLSSLHGRRSIEKQYDEISKRIKQCNTPILVFVDDVDRLLRDEAIAVLKLIRNTADFPNLYYLVAADKSALCEMISSEPGISNPDIYIKKFFNFELVFPACEERIQRDLMSFLPELFDKTQRNEIETYVGKLHYLDAAFSNHRDVVRFYNLIAFAIDSMRAEGVNVENEILPTDFIGVSILQYVDSDIYKLLRDHDDYLLVCIGTDKRLSLKEEYRDIVRDRFFIRQLDKMSIDRCEKPEDKEQMQKEFLDSLPKELNEAVSDVTPSKLDLVCSILSSLFYDRINYRDKRSVSFADNFFLYFAQKFRKNEIPKSQAIELLMLDDDNFKSEIKTLISENKEDSFLLGVSLYADRINCAPIQAFKNVLTLLDVIYSSTDKLFTLGEFLQNSDFKSIIARMYLMGVTDENAEEKRQIERQMDEFFRSDSRIGLLAAALLSFRKPENYKFVFAGDTIEKWRKIVSERYIEKILKKGEFQESKLEPFKDMKKLYPGFMDMFYDFAKNMEDKEFWVYNMVMPLKDNGKYDWNSRFRELLDASGSDLNRFAHGILDDDTYHVISLDLKSLSSMDSLSTLAVDEHPFLKAAKEWREA